MKSSNWARACGFATIALIGSLLFVQGQRSHADDAKADSQPEAKKASAPKIDLTPEEGFGTLKGQFVLDGEIPKLSPIGKPTDRNGADIATCGGTTVPNEKLVVDAKTKGIANVFVYIQKTPATIHPKLEKSAVPVIEFDQKVCQFFPRAMFVRLDQTVKVMSADPVPHNTHTHPIRNEEKNLTIAPKDRVGFDLNFTTAEKLPVQVGCDIHTWMLSHWLILDHPYAAITDAEGKFAIGKLPAGDHKLIVWHESAGYIIKEFKVTIPDNGVEDKGTIKVDVSKFKFE